MTTALEAYLTGVVATGLSMYGLPDHLHAMTVVDDQGQVNGVIELHTPEGQVRATVIVTEMRWLEETDA